MLRGGRRGGRGGGVVAGALIGAAVGGAIANRRDDDGEEEEYEEEEEGPKCYAMREKLISIGDSFNINRMSRRRGRGTPAYIANNKVLRLRETFEIQTLDRDTLYQIQERKMRVRDSMAIEDANGDKVAEIKKRAVGIIRDNFVLKIRGEKNWQIHGTILEHDFTINEGGDTIATVHKNWIAPIRDTYFVDIAEGVDEGLVLCVVTALEAMSEDWWRKNEQMHA